MYSLYIYLKLKYTRIYTHLYAACTLACLLALQVLW